MSRCHQSNCPWGAALRYTVPLDLTVSMATLAVGYAVYRSGLFILLGISKGAFYTGSLAFLVIHTAYYALLILIDR